MPELVGAEAGDVIQIAPGAGSALDGCFAEVEEVRPWGVVAFVLVPGGFRGADGAAYVRLEIGQFRRVGKAPYERQGP